MFLIEILCDIPGYNNILIKETFRVITMLKKL